MKGHNYNNLGKTFAKYVSFNILGMIGISCYILADTVFVARGMGSMGLAALNLALPVFNLIYGAGLLIGMGSATKYTILNAMEEKEEANHYFTLGLFAALFISILFVLAGVFFTEPISELLGSDPSTKPYTVIYLRTVMSFAPMFCLNHFMLCFVRNDGNPKLASYATLAGSFANIVFDYIFIFPMNMGMLGAALATGMSPVIGLGILSIHMIQKKNQFHFIKTKFQVSRLWVITKLGFSSFINEISAGVVIYVFNILILQITGNIGVAAYGVIANIALVITSLFTGIGQGIQPLVSYYYGKEDKGRTEKTLWYAVILSLGLGILSYLVVYVFRIPLIQVFNEENSHQLAAIAEKGMILYFIGFLPSGFNVAATFYLTAREQATKGLMVSILRGLVFIAGLAVLLANLLGMTGVWLAFPCAEFATAAVAIYYLWKK